MDNYMDNKLGGDMNIIKINKCDNSKILHSASHYDESEFSKIALMLTIAGLVCISLVLSTNAVAKPARNSSATMSQSIEDTLSAEELSAYKSFQNNADIVRLNHMKYWVDLIEEYYDKTGEYPLQGQTMGRLNVLVATPDQQQYTYSIPGIEEESMTNFVDTLEQGLGYEIDEYYDPQYAPDDKPNYYIYMIHGDTYNFAIHTHQNYSFSRHVARNYNKVEVSNVYTRNFPKILKPEMLFESAEYMEAANQQIERVGFFEQREALTLHATKDE